MIIEEISTLESSSDDSLPVSTTYKTGKYNTIDEAIKSILWQNKKYNKRVCSWDRMKVIMIKIDNKEVYRLA